MSMILTLDQNGQPHSWCGWQTAVCYKAKDMIKWSLGEIAFTAHGGKSKYTGEQSVITVPSIIAISNNTVPKYRTPVLTNKNLFRRDLNICGYCGRTFREEKLTRDHILATFNGGKDNWTNTITCCKPCNNYKGSSLLEDLDIDLLYVPYVPDKNEMLILKNRNIRGDQMEFVRNFLPDHSRAHRLEVYN